MRPRTTGCSLPPSLDISGLVPETLGLRIASTAWPSSGPADIAPAKYRHKAGPYAFQTSRQVLRDLLTTRVRDVPPEEWVLAHSPQGQPMVLGPVTGFQVSIAYAGSLCAVAALQERAVGLDLERLPCRLDDDLPKHLLSSSEIRLTREDPDTFVTIWTLKEALAKEIGVGLMGDAAAIDTAAYALTPSGRLRDRPDGGAVFHDRFRLGDNDYAVALTLGPPRG